MKKVLSVLLSIVLLLTMLSGVFGVLPLSASAREVDLASEAEQEITMVVGGTKTVYCRGSLPTFVTGGWNKSGDAVNIDARGETCIVTGVREGTATVSGWTQSKQTIIHPGYYYLGTFMPGWNEEQLQTDRVSYKFRVVSSGGSSSSGSSSSSSSSNLSTPSITGFESLASGVKITWGAVSGAAKYRVYYKGRNGWTKMGDTTSNSFVDTDVSSGSTYTYTVRCINSSATAFTSNYNATGWRYTYNMATPKITSMTSSTSGVRINWSSVKNAEKYRVYYKGRNGWTKMADVTGTSYLDSDVSFGSTYTYTVRCINSSATRFTSDCNSSGWKHTHYLSTPKISGFDSTADGVKITWGSVGAAKYCVYYKGRNGWTRMGVTTGTSFVDDDVRVGSTYRYTVRAINSDLSKFTSDCNSDGWTYTYNPNLSTPRITSCETVSNGIKINWGAVSGATIYRIYYKNSYGSWVRMADTRSTSYLDTDVRYDKTYTYTVRCLSTDGKNFVSSYDSRGKSHAYVEKPEIWSIYDYADGISVNWTYRNGTDKYYIYRKSNGSGWTRVAEIKGNNHWQDTNVQNGVTYTYTVRAVDESGDFISYYNMTGWSCTYPQATNLPYIDTIKLYSDGDIYLMLKGELKDDYTEILVKNGSTTRSLGKIYGKSGYLDNTGLSGGKTYTFIVRCVDYWDQAVYPYDKNGAAIKLLSAPDNMDDKVKSDTKIEITWDPVDGASYYVLDIENNGSNIKVYGTSYTLDVSSYADGNYLWYATVYAVGSNGKVTSDKDGDFLSVEIKNRKLVKSWY